MTNPDYELSKLLEDEDRYNNDLAEMRAQLNDDLKLTFETAQLEGVFIPLGIDIATTNLDDVDKIFASSEEEDDISEFLTIAGIAATALFSKRSEDKDGIMDTALVVIGTGNMDVTEKLKWVKVIEKTTGERIISSEDGDITKELESITKIAAGIESQRPAVIINQRARAFVKESLDEAITELYGIHDNQAQLVGFILKCSEILVTHDAEDQEELDRKVNSFKGLIRSLTNTRNISDEDLDKLISSTTSVLRKHGFKKI